MPILEIDEKKVAGHFPEYSNITSEMTGILPIMHKNAHQLPCKILWNPHWTTEIGLTGEEEHEQVFSKLYLYAYVLKHMAKDTNIVALLTIDSTIQKRFFNINDSLLELGKEIKQGTPKLEKLLETHNLVNNDLPLIHKELERKAKAILDQRKTKKTPVDTLRRMLEGLHAHLKTTSISISKEAENSNTRTKLRRILTETKGKALETIELINSTDKTLQISYEDFNEGVFPWETVLDRDDTQFPTLSLADKYHIVGCWMLLKRAREEITLSKKEMMSKNENETTCDFVCEKPTNDYEPEFKFDTSDEENYDSLSESEYSEEETESSSSYSEDDESAI
uniref:Uncharacterized protein n=1 Tax=Daphnia galeata TaxID=27404 RepID=A0A8J2RGH0_9CRUS|nr:unnamed protein product [Daphnia galeata]